MTVSSVFARSVKDRPWPSGGSGHHIEAGTKDYYSHVIYSNDDGDTWRLGGSTPEDQVNECQVVELISGRLLLNMRNYDLARRNRQAAISTDGGLTWRDQGFDPTLIEPICQASIRCCSCPGEWRQSVILFWNPARQTGRVNMTVRAGYDESQTWPAFRTVHLGPSAYSDLAVKHPRIFLLYERGEDNPYERTTLALDWLTRSRR